MKHFNLSVAGFLLTATLAAAACGAGLAAHRTASSARMRFEASASSRTASRPGESSRQLNFAPMTGSNGPQRVGAGPVIKRIPEYFGGADTDHRLMGTCVYADYVPGQYFERGMYAVPRDESGDFALLMGSVNPTGGGVEIDGKYYCVEYVDPYSSHDGTEIIALQCYNVDDWTLVYEKEEPGDYTQVATAMAYDPTTGKVFGCFNNKYRDAYEFGTIDVLGDWTRTTLGDMSYMMAMGVDRSGRLFAIDTHGRLFRVDKATGATTLVGDTGLDPQYTTSGTIDPQSNRFYFIVTRRDENDKIFSALYSINIETAEATMLTHFKHNQEVIGLFVPSPKYDAEAPAAPADMSFEFTDDEYTGLVKFTAPSQTYSGTALTGTLTYSITDYGDEIASGTVAPGERLEVVVELEYDGGTDIGVEISNEAGTGPMSYVEILVGDDFPNSVENVYAERVDGKVNISWDAVTTGVENGWLNIDNIRYTVTRFPDNVKIAEKTSALSCSDELPAEGDSQSYYYGVVAHNGIFASRSTSSNRIYVSGIVPPYFQPFDKYADHKDFTIIDANGDQGWIWKYEQFEKQMEMLSSWWVETDDWLVTPPVILEKGMTYRHSVKLASSFGGDSIATRFEIRYGKGNDVAALKTVGIPETVIEHDDFREYSFYITPDEDGAYFIGYHATMPANWSSLFLDDISIEAGISTLTPVEVSNLTATADDHRLVTISFTAPDKAIDGSDINGLEKIEVYRDGELAAIRPNVPANDRVTLTDGPVAAGNHTYTVIPFNASGRGKAVSVDVFAGIRRPQTPAAAFVKEEGNTGKVTVSWQAVTVDVDGNPLPEGAVSYDVYLYGSTEPVASGLTELSYTCQAVPADTQDLVCYEVYAATESGRSAASAITDMIPAGKAYPLPFLESAAGGKASTLAAMTSGDGFTYWTTATDDVFSDVQSFDSDNGFFMMYSPYTAGSSTLFLGKIDLSGAEHPALSLRAFNLGGEGRDSNTLTVRVREAGGEWRSLKSVTMDEFDEEGWNRITCPLNDFVGKTVQVQFSGLCDYYSTMFVDHVTIEELPGVDLAIKRVDVPAVVSVGKPFTTRVLVENHGSELMTADRWNVEMAINGLTVATAPGKRIAFEQIGVITLETVRDMTSEEDLEIEIKIVAQGDVNTENNMSSALTSVDFPMVVPASGLTAARADNGSVILTWNEPDMSQAAPAESLEDFEGYDAWEYEQLGDWTLTDADGSVIGGIVGYDFPNIPDLGQGPCGFFVIDSEYDFGDFQSLFGARSGRRFVGQFYNKSGVADDWLISPELYGGRQTLSFHARSFSPTIGESLEVLVSDNGTSTGDFRRLADYKVLSTDWHEYQVALPSGTKHFALRCTSRDGYMLFIDDVNFIPAGSPRELSLLGYNVYRNMELLNQSPLKDAAFTDSSARPDDRYFVTAVYAEGESRASNVVTPATSGVENVAYGQIRVSADRTAIVVDCATGLEISIYSTDGMLRASAVSSGHNVVPVSKGVYIVKVGDKVSKVIVR